MRAIRFAVAVAVAAGFGACAAADAGAFTLTLSFPDGQPMTWGSACGGAGCMARNERIQTTDDRGQVQLPNGVRAIEYRRDGIVLSAAPAGVASGTTLAAGDRATVILPRLLVGSAPAVDADESDLVARLNEARAAQGLPMAQINPRLSAAADLQAAWLTQSGASALEPGSFHDGPFGTGVAFRHGEVSLPEPASGGEVAAAGGTIDETVTDWLSSEEHRREVLTPGPLLFGVGRVGAFTVVETHTPCSGCERAGTGTRAGAGPAPGPVVAAPPTAPAPALAAAAPTAGSSAAALPLPSCGREQLTVRRLRSRAGRVWLRVGVHCLRPGARYMLLIRRNATGRQLVSLPIKRAGTGTLTVRPGITAKRLRIKLKRDGHVIAVHTTSLPTS
jgi:hypothetical protein